MSFIIVLLAWVAPVHATLTVINGDFTDLTGLTPTGGEWYHGVPSGWTSTGPTTYTVNITSGYGNPTPPMVNIDGLGDLKQSVGTTTNDPVVTLTFDVGTFNSAPSVTARIIAGTAAVATGTYGTGTGHTLKAIVPVGSSIEIEFSKNAGSGSPWIDNVSVTEGTDTNLINNGTFSNGLARWIQGSWAGGTTWGVNANGPADTSASSGNYAYAGGGTFNLLQQNIGGVTNGGVYRLTFQVGSKAGEASTSGVLSLFDGLAGNYNDASFNYRPSHDAFGTFTVDFIARGATELWLRNDGGGYAAYDNVSVTPIASVTHALNYSSAAGYAEVTSALSGSGKVTVDAGSGGLTFWAANTYSGGTEVTGGTLFIANDGTCGDPSGPIVISNTASTATLDLRNAQTRTGTITMIGQGARLASGDVNNPGSLVNNGGALEMGGGLISVSVSGSGGLNVTGGGSITSSNSYTGATTISDTMGWYGLNKLFVAHANALGAASGDLTISGGTVDLEGNTITRSGNVTLAGGTLTDGVLSKDGGNFDLQHGGVNVSLAGTAGLVKTGTNWATLAGANSYTGDTLVSEGTLYVQGVGTLGDGSGAVTISNAIVDLRNAQTQTGVITMIGQEARLISGDPANLPGSILNNGNAVEFGGGLISVSLSGSGGLNVTGGGSITSSNSYTGPTTISATPGWYGSDTFFVDHTHALGDASANLTISGGAVSLMTNTIIRSGNVTISGGHVHTGTLVKTGSDYDIRGGQIDAVLDGTVGLVKSGHGTATLAAASYTGTTSVTGGTLVISNSILTATILTNSIAVDFPSAPAPGTYVLLPGPLASGSLASTTVTAAGESLSAGLTTTFTNSPSLALVVQNASTPTPQESYLASFGLSGSDLVGTADPDGDGMDNSAEFAFGTSPVSGASRAATLSSGTGQIKLSYLQRKGGAVTYTVKSLPSLTTSFDSGTTVTPSLSADQANLPSGDYERYEASLNTGSSQGFLRVKAVQ